MTRVNADDDAPPGRVDVDRALYEEVGRRLRAQREALGLTEEYMARRLAVSTSHYHRYETGQRRVPLSDLLMAARVLSIAPSSVLGPPGAAPPRRRRLPAELLRELERELPLMLEEVELVEILGGARSVAVAAAVATDRRVWAYRPPEEDAEHRHVLVRIGEEIGARLRRGEVAVVNLDAIPVPGDVVLTASGDWAEVHSTDDRLRLLSLHGALPIAGRPLGVVRAAMRPFRR